MTRHSRGYHFKARNIEISKAFHVDHTFRGSVLRRSEWSVGGRAEPRPGVEHGVLEVGACLSGAEERALVGALPPALDAGLAKPPRWVELEGLGPQVSVRRG